MPPRKRAPPPALPSEVEISTACAWVSGVGPGPGPEALARLAALGEVLKAVRRKAVAEGGLPARKKGGEAPPPVPPDAAAAAPLAPAAAAPAAPAAVAPAAAAVAPAAAAPLAPAAAAAAAAPGLRCVAFTDGACSGNGGRAPRAGFGAVLCRAGAWPPEVITQRSGAVAPTTYSLAGGEVVAAAPPAVAPSNNRGELLGIAAALAVAREAGAAALEVVSDSAYAIGCVSEWYPAWVAGGSGADAAAHKNLDIIAAASGLLAALERGGCAVTFTHCRGHRPPPAPGAPPAAQLVHWGNGLADKLAVAAAATAASA